MTCAHGRSRPSQAARNLNTLLSRKITMHPVRLQRTRVPNFSGGIQVVLVTQKNGTSWHMKGEGLEGGGGLIDRCFHLKSFYQYSMQLRCQRKRAA